MAHYFDDIFQRTIELGTPHSSGMPKIRRSSTARSIGARSDYDASVNGTEDDARSTTNSVSHNSPERARERSDADSHLHQYISDQLRRYRGEDSASANVLEHEDEFETKA